MVNVIKNHILFPTIVSEFEYVADKNLLNAIKNEELFPPSNRLSSRSVNSNLQKKKEYEPLVNKILNTTKEVCKLYEYEYKSLEITSLWINLAKTGDFHSPHTHSNNIFSGVWYPTECKTTPIMFIDPRQQNGQWAPKRKKSNNFTATLVSLLNKKNTGYIFPSWLLHFVPPAVSPRISISWNVLLRGEYGEPDTLQNAHI